MHSDTEAIRVIVAYYIFSNVNKLWDKDNFREKQHESKIFDIYEITKFSYNNGIRTSEQNRNKKRK